MKVAKLFKVAFSSGGSKRYRAQGEVCALCALSALSTYPAALAGCGVCVLPNADRIASLHENWALYHGTTFSRAENV